MKKLVITLVIASLHSVAFAGAGQKAGQAIKEGEQVLKGRQIGKPGAQGTKVNVREASDTAQSAGQSASEKDFAARQEAKQTKGGTCDANSPVSKVGKDRQASLVESARKGIAGSACATSFESPDTVAYVADADQATMEKLASMNLDNVNQANLAQRLELRNTWEQSLAKSIGVDEKDADERTKKMCDAGCDHLSPALCAVN